MLKTIKHKKPSKDPTRKTTVGGLSLSSLVSRFKKAEKATGTLKSAKKAPTKDSFLARLFGKKSTDAKAKKQESTLSRNTASAKKTALSKKSQESEGQKAQAKKQKNKLRYRKLT